MHQRYLFECNFASKDFKLLKPSGFFMYHQV